MADKGVLSVGLKTKHGVLSVGIKTKHGVLSVGIKTKQKQKQKQTANNNIFNLQQTIYQVTKINYFSHIFTFTFITDIVQY